MAYVRKKSTASSTKIKKLPYDSSKPARVSAEPYRGGATVSTLSKSSSKAMKKTSTPISKVTATRKKQNLMEKKIQDDFRRK